MDYGFYSLVVGALVVWRVTHLLQAEDGPWRIVVRLRLALGPGILGELMDCFYCLSVWVAVPLAFVCGRDLVERILMVPALSAGAILLERVTKARETAPDATVYFEDDSKPLSDEANRRASSEREERGGAQLVPGAPSHDGQDQTQRDTED